MTEAAGSTAKPGLVVRAGRGVLDVGKGAGRAGVAVVRGYWSGFAYPLKGMKFVYLKHPELARIWVWPIVITGLCFLGVTAGVWLWHGALLDLMWARPAGDVHGFWATVGHGLLIGLWWVVRALLFLLLLLVGYVAVYILSTLCAAPFRGPLSEEVERLYTGVKPPEYGFVDDLLLTLRLEVGKLLVFVAVMVPTFVLSLLVPVVGQIIYAIFGYFFTIIYFAIDYTDWPLARRGRGVRERLRVLRKYFLRMLGLGTGVWLLLFIPIVGLFFMPAAVAGGTMMVLDMEAEGELERK